jgi:flavodoxin
VNLLIVYFSQTGNTAKVARAIYEDVSSQNHEVHLKKIAEITSNALNAYDLVFLGSACHDTDLAKPVKRVLEGIASSPPFKLAGFATHAAYTPEGGEREREVYEEWASRCDLSFRQTSRETLCANIGETTLPWKLV